MILYILLTRVKHRDTNSTRVMGFHAFKIDDATFRKHRDYTNMEPPHWAQEYYNPVRITHVLGGLVLTLAVIIFSRNNGLPRSQLICWHHASWGQIADFQINYYVASQIAALSCSAVGCLVTPELAIIHQFSESYLHQYSVSVQIERYS